MSQKFAYVYVMNVYQHSMVFFIELPRNIKILVFDTLTMSEKLFNLPVLNREHPMSMLAHPEFTEVRSAL